MAFEPGKAVVVTDAAHLAQYGRALRKVGKKIVVVPLSTGLHAGHIALIRAAKSMLGATVFVTYAGEEVPEEFAREGVDVVFHGALDTAGVQVRTGMDHLEDAGEVAAQVAQVARVARVAAPAVPRRTTPRLCGTHLDPDHAPATPDPCGGAP